MDMLMSSMVVTFMSLQSLDIVIFLSQALNHLLSAQKTPTTMSLASGPSTPSISFPVGDAQGD